MRICCQIYLSLALHYCSTHTYTVFITCTEIDKTTCDGFVNPVLEISIRRSPEPKKVALGTMPDLSVV